MLGPGPCQGLPPPRPSWPPWVDRQSHRHATQAHSTLPGVRDPAGFQTRLQRQRTGVTFRVTIRSHQPHAGLSGAAQDARGATDSPPPALYTPRARSALSMGKRFLTSRDYFVTGENDRRLTVQCPQWGSPGATTLLPYYPRAAASQPQQCGLAAEEVRGPRGLEDTARSLRKTSAHPVQSLTRLSSFQRHEGK